MEAHGTPQEKQTPEQSAEKPSGASESRVPGLSTMPKKRPPRRLFGLLAGKR